MASPDVLLLRWPDEDHRRPEHAGRSRPTVLVCERGGPVPRKLGPLEDWLFHDATPEEVALRVELLAARVSELDDTPRLDDALLRHRGRWVAISDIQLPVVQLLIEHLDSVVPGDDLAAAYAAAGGSTHDASFRALMFRVGRRLRSVDLTVTSIRGRGFIATPTPPDRPKPDLAPWSTDAARPEADGG